MTKKQLAILYSILVFIIVWGLGLLNAVKYKIAIGTGDIFSLFNASQTIYILCTLIFTRLLFQKFYSRKKVLQLFLSILLLIVFFILLRYMLEEIFFPAFFGSRNYNPNTSFLFYVLDNIYYALIYIILGIFIFLLDEQVRAGKKQALLQQQNREAELAFLRSQINPHFLFNSLNNIYSLSYKRSDRAPEAILKLGNLMRYMLYEKKDLVLLNNEWQYVQNFISLQQLRYDYPLELDVKINGDLDSMLIPPYILVPFVENAFKHGNFTDAAQPVKIYLSVSGDQMDFFIENKIAQQAKDAEGGIGLENVKRRLQLLYPGRHILDLQLTKEKFSIHLQLTNPGSG